MTAITTRHGHAVHSVRSSHRTGERLGLVPYTEYVTDCGRVVTSPWSLATSGAAANCKKCLKRVGKS